MNNFLKSLQINEEDKHTFIKPWEIFDNLVSNKEYGYLRAAQKEFLQEWYEKRKTKDIIGLLNTGAGKTIIGLLALQSELNEGNGPAIYLCPTKQLVTQVINEAHNININAITFPDTGQFPIKFKEGSCILVTTFDKLFNGFSKFGIDSADYVKIGSMVIDDAHAVIDKAINNTTVKIARDKYGKQYDEILNLFKLDLERQSNRKFRNVKDNVKRNNIVIKVPYWTIVNNKDTLINILQSINDPSVNLPLQFVLEAENDLDVYIDVNEIDIMPKHVPVKMVPSFANARHRLFLSATLSNKEDLITELGVSAESVLKPIIINEDSDSGEKLIIAPQRINSKLTDDIMREIIYKNTCNGDLGANTVVLVPSYKKANIWEKLGAILLKNDDINYIQERLEEQNNKVWVIVNRYDGIDLKDNLCNCLVLDGMPMQTTLRNRSISQRYEKSNKVNSMASQKIEQGMGRAVRSKTDNAIIFLLGDKLQEIVSKKDLSDFSLVTRAQLKFADKIIKNGRKDDPETVLTTLISASINKEPNWEKIYHSNISQYYKELINSDDENDKIRLFEKVRGAWDYKIDRNYEEAVHELLSSKSSNSEYKGFLYEEAASYIYPVNRERAIRLQNKAYKYNSYLFRTQQSQYNLRKDRMIEARKILDFAKERGFEDLSGLRLWIINIQNDLVYSQNKEEFKFRKAVYKLGILLGYNSSQPEAESTDGPDNLWRSKAGDIVIECKNQAFTSSISRHYIEQIDHSGNWYREKYCSENFDELLFQKTAILDNNAHASDKVYVVDEEGLEKLKKALNSLAEFIGNASIDDLSTQNLEDILTQYHLTQTQFIQFFTRKPKHNAKRNS